ncbi:MltF family protein [Marinoscillum furvescens]|uniref:Membrane-bound lytic murein transglycosylase F n=1 Tax=Marinoscillum furvescens DSM 4134 TaxID=1122208 RepID=A0A3D9L1V5_MARFU|nr:transporter substrate-binding domain-containing protein [Marinoscillum furvescens]RED94905.1 membrane-bound lytic murein transglycosylase F [Marinoscillum furvescens DSM 4134]
MIGCQQADPTAQETGSAGKDTLAEESFVDSFLNRIHSSTQFHADLEDILERDTLKAITTYSSTSYFLYRGQPMGYEYELAAQLASELGVELEMIVADDIDQIFNMLNEGEGDIITYGLTVTRSRRQIADFTLPLNFTHQSLVQRKPDNWRQMKLHELEKVLVRNPIRLIGLDVHVRQGSSYNDRLLNLQDELGGEINIHYLPGNLSTDEIMKMVASGEIDYTIADHNLASINATYYRNLDIQTTVGVMQQLAWAVRKTSPELKARVNEWLKAQRKEDDFYVTYNKYFKNSRAFTTRVKSQFYSKEGDKISRYDDLMRAAATEINWDWRLLAAQVYQESRFDPKTKSWAGAVGLMQLMPKTAKSYGYSKLTNPKTSLEAGIAHLDYLDAYWSKHIADSTERLKFVLASYNAGHNHVQDARRLAEKNGQNPNLWYDHVEEALLMKSQKKYFNDPVVKYGYCRGEEPVNYVKEIIERYRYYQEFVPEEVSS